MLMNVPVTSDFPEFVFNLYYLLSLPELLPQMPATEKRSGFSVVLSVARRLLDLPALCFILLPARQTELRQALALLRLVGTSLEAVRVRSFPIAQCWLSFAV